MFDFNKVKVIKDCELKDVLGVDLNYVFGGMSK